MYSISERAQLGGRSLKQDDTVGCDWHGRYASVGRERVGF